MISIIDSRIGIEFWKRWESNDLNGINEIIEQLEKPFSKDQSQNMDGIDATKQFLRPPVT